MSVKPAAWAKPPPAAKRTPSQYLDASGRDNRTELHVLPNLDSQVKRLRSLLVCCCVLASCRIEPTPQEYIDAQATPVDAIATAEAEARTRIHALPEAVAGGNVGALDLTLSPHANVSIAVPDERRTIGSMDELMTTFRRLAGGRPVRITDLDMTVAAGVDVAWFVATFEISEADQAGPPILFSGVFQREGGEWRLVQGHLSQAITVEPR